MCKSIYPIYWHKQNLKNWVEHLENSLKKLGDLKEEIKADRRGIAFYKLQIEMAKKKGKTAFDRDKFLIGRK